MNKQIIDISSGIIWRTIFILLALWFLYLIRDIIALLVVSIIIVSAIDPIVDWLQKKKIPRSGGVLAVYLCIFLIFGAALSFLIPPLAEQFKSFAVDFSVYSQKLEIVIESVKNFFQAQHLSIDLGKLASSLSDNLSNIPQKIFTGTVGFFSGFVSIAIILSMTFYMTVKENGIKQFIISIMPEKHKDYAASLTDRIKEKIGAWMRGQLLLMFIIFVFIFIGLSIVKIPYALSLAIFAGIMEIVPYVGPIVSAIPGVFIGFLISPWVGFSALLVYVIVQQIENHIIIPQVMKRAVGLNPIAIILSLLIGAKLGGAFGAILAVPIATVASVFISDFFKDNK